MLYSLTGKIIKKELNAVVISCGGVGYYVMVPSTAVGALPAEGREATVYTVMIVSENDVALYGFATEQQKNCFNMLISVSGVGPKVGLAILSAMEPERVALSISAGDFKAFTAASGVGNKLAQRIALELKDKVSKTMVEGVALGEVSAAAQTEAGAGGQAIAALVSLGFNQSEAALVVAKLDQSLTVQELITQALKQLAGRR